MAPRYRRILKNASQTSFVSCAAVADIVVVAIAAAGGANSDFATAAVVVATAIALCCH